MLSAIENPQTSSWDAAFMSCEAVSTNVAAFGNDGEVSTTRTRTLQATSAHTTANSATRNEQQTTD